MNLANRLTMLRILLVPAFVAALLYYTPETAYLYFVALGTFFTACVTDGLDGYLAKKMDQKTEFGSYMDPVADKLLLVSGFLSLSLMGHLPDEMHVPAWVTIPIIARDVVILLGSLIVFMATGKLKAKPLFIGKLTTVAQMATLSLSLVMAPLLFRQFLDYLTVGLTVWSGALYMRMGGRMFQEA